MSYASLGRPTPPTTISDGISMRRIPGATSMLLVITLLSACGSTEKNVGLLGGITVLGAQAPTQEIQQTYYLGVFDPQEQLPPTVYRVRVHGQASFISFTKFASGWVPAALIDSLGSNVSIAKKSGKVSIDKASTDETVALKTGRRLMMFGPEGFREAPAGHRLVIVMGSSPEKFFEAIDTSLEQVAGTLERQRAAGLERKLFESLVLISSERKQLGRLRHDVDLQFPVQ